MLQDFLGGGLHLFANQVQLTLHLFLVHLLQGGYLSLVRFLGLAKLFLERCLQVFDTLLVGILHLCQGFCMALLLGIQLLFEGLLL